MYFKQFIFEADPQFSCIIEENGRTAYAYLLHKSEIIADVWLYNADFTPDNSEWTKMENAPFRNAVKYCKQPNPIQPIGEATQIEVDWELIGVDLESVSLRVDEILIAKLIPYKYPGFSLGAERDGPLACVLG